MDFDSKHQRTAYGPIISLQYLQLTAFYINIHKIDLRTAQLSILDDRLKWPDLH